MVLGFNKRFEQPINLQTKIHTIRHDVNKRWKEGNSIQFATGVRTKNYHCFGWGVCLSVQEISIRWGNPVTIPNYAKVFIDGRCLTEQECNELAVNDGFENFEEFLKWDAWCGKDFDGRLIHWTSKRY